MPADMGQYFGVENLDPSNLRNQYMEDLGQKSSNYR